MTEWAPLWDAYGSADQVPALLAAAEETDAHEGGLWDDLWGRLCHQGTVYSGSYAALPALTEMSRRRTPAGYVPALHLAAAIIASTDGPDARSPFAAGTRGRSPTCAPWPPATCRTLSTTGSSCTGSRR